MENRASLKKTARLAGLLGLIMGIPLPFSLFYVPSQIIVSGDADATAHNVLAREFMFRAGIVGHLFSATVFLFLVLVLYRLLKWQAEYSIPPHCQASSVSVRRNSRYKADEQ